MKSGCPEISIVLPCQNEQDALPICLRQIEHVIKKHNLSAEIIVSDSSRDRSPEIAHTHNVRLIKHDRDGYGIAIRTGLSAARGRYFFIADPDGSYDFNEIPRFVTELQKGSDVVIGRRVNNRMRRGAMPWHHKYIGNPVLSFLLCSSLGRKYLDAHCGMRAITAAVLSQFTFHSTGMEFASEFIVEAHRAGLHISQHPIDYYRRYGTSKLRWWRDGWRHALLILYAFRQPYRSAAEES